MLISIFKNKEAHVSESTLNIKEIAEVIRTGTFQQPNDLVNQPKASLPAATFGAWFLPGHTARKQEESKYQSNGLACLDFDELAPEALTSLRTQMLAEPHTMLAIISPSGAGLKVVVPINDLERNNYKQVYQALLAHYKHLTGRAPDPAPSNIVSLCFLPHDPQVHFNGQATRYQAKELLKQHQPTPRPMTPVMPATRPTRGPEAYTAEKGADLARVQQVLADCQEKGISLTQTYPAWFAVGCALHHAFGAKTGGELFHEFSRQDACYNKNGCEDQFEAIVASGGSHDSPTTLASFFRLVKDAGLMIPRHPDATPATSGSNGTGRQPVRTVIQAYLQAQYQVYFDAGTNVLYLANKDERNPEHFQPITERSPVLNGLLTTMDANGITASKTALWEVVNNPGTYTEISILRATLDFLAVHHDGQDHLSALLNTIDVGAHDQDLFAHQFTKWLVACVAQAYGTADAYQFRNEHAPVLVGTQSLGKSGFFQNLLWDDKYYFDGSNFDFTNKNHLVNLATKVLICLEEMHSHSKADISLLKAVLSQHKISLDRKFQDERDYKRTGNFCGCTNHSDFLKDSTGDRRFLVFEMRKPLDFAAYNGIDKRQLWGQLAVMLKQGFDYKFTYAENEATITRNRAGYTVQNQEDYFIESEMRVTGNHDDFISNVELAGVMNAYISANRGHTPRMNDREVKTKLRTQGAKLDQIKKVMGKAYKGIRGVQFREQDPGNACNSSLPVSRDFHPEQNSEGPVFHLKVALP